MVPIICLYVGGALSLWMAFFHARFYKIFGWKTDFEKISFVNSKILYTIHLALLLLFLIIGAISLCYAKEFGRSIGLAAGLNCSLSISGFGVLSGSLLISGEKKTRKCLP